MACSILNLMRYIFNCSEVQELLCLHQSFYTQLFSRQLAENGYAGLAVRTTPLKTEIIIKATKTQDVLGEKGQRIRELTSVVQKRYV